MTIEARFDDLRPRHRRSFRLENPIEVLEAHSPEEVIPTLERVEDAVRRGNWVAGWVCYEAAPAFDPALVVRDFPGTPLEDLPLVWFAVFESRGGAGPAGPGTEEMLAWEPSVSDTEHAKAVATIRREIREGRTYQVNYTFRMSSAFDGSAASLYGRLTHSQNAAYGAFLDTGRWVVASASPELFLEWRHGKIVCRPMKGTTNRGTDLARDEAQRTWLEHSEKNRAENLMIVDMVRNDLGRVCRTGSVKVPALFTTEKYDTVWQLTSTVTGEPRPDTSLAGVFGSLFPCASITGAPKVATMGIIAELESDPRGVYCGAVGFGGPGTDGSPEWAFNVGIRTVLIDRAAHTAWYGTGGGVTYDSTAEDEYREALLKAEVLSRSTPVFSLLETMRWDPATGFGDLAGHLRRLADSAWYFDVPLDPAEVRAALDRATRGHEAPLRLRLLVDREGWVSVEAEPAPPPQVDPVVVAIDGVPIDPSDPFLHHKTTNRRVYREALERHPGFDDVVLVGPGGEVTETTIANIAALVDGEWRTPPLSSGCLPGVHRARLVAAGELVEVRLSVDDLRRARSVVRFNSVRGVETCTIS